MTNEAKHALDKALTAITLAPSLAFWAGLSVQVPKVLTDEVPTAATDGERLLFNPEFLLSLTEQQRVFLILHELLHIIRMDSLRIGERDPKVWNIAADAVINDLLMQMVHDAPVERIPGGVYPEDELAPLKGQSSEWNYKWLRDKQPDDENDAANNGGGRGEDQDTKGAPIPESFDEIIPNSTASSKSERANKEAEVRRMVQAAAQMAREQGRDPTAGNAPAWLRELVAEITQPKVNWREEMRQFMTSVAEQDWSWKRPHTSILMSTGCIAPTVQDQPGIPNVFVLLDSSASVDDKMLAQAWGEIIAMSDVIKSLSVGHFTTQLEAVDTYDLQVDTPDDITPKQRYVGGTDVRRALADLRDMAEAGEVDLPDVLVVISDMEFVCPTDAHDLGVPTLWVSLGGAFDAPWGKTIEIKE